MTCTCRSFPDRICGCHLPGASHVGCTCACEMTAATRGGDHNSEWPDVDAIIASLGTCQVCGHYTTDRYCYRTDRCKEAGGAEVM